jgi:hypothetical protein
LLVKLLKTAAKPIFYRQPVNETALARTSTRGGERRRFACSFAVLTSTGGRKLEFAAVQPQPMHSHSQLTRHCDNGAFVAALRRDPQPPRFDAAPLLRAYQHGAGRLVECGAYLAIAALGDVALDVDGIAGFECVSPSGQNTPQQPSI